MTESETRATFYDIKRAEADHHEQTNFILTHHLCMPVTTHPRDCLSAHAHIQQVSCDHVKNRSKFKTADQESVYVCVSERQDSLA